MPHRPGGTLGKWIATLPASEQPARIEEFGRPSHWEQAAREFRSVAPILRAAVGMQVPDVPVVAVVGGKAGAGQRKVRTVVRQAYEIWLPTLPQGRLVLAPDSGHMVPHDDPDLVVEVVSELVRQVRG